MRVGMAAALLALAHQVKAAYEVEFNRGGSTCPGGSVYCKDFNFNVFKVVADGVRTLFTSGTGSVDSDSLSSGDNCLDIVGAKAIISCSMDDMAGNIQSAFNSAGESALAVCRSNIPPKNYKCRDFRTTVFFSDPIPASACSTLSNNVLQTQNDCASFLTTAKAWGIIIGCTIAGAAVIAGLCYVGYKCKQRERANNRGGNGAAAVHLPRHGMRVR
ncbi:MAG: hypothetical protein P1U63_02090 [Coxiellaceae bacterium]|nr:hypothetical protein [Coxiellaceae bacterium]